MKSSVKKVYKVNANYLSRSMKKKIKYNSKHRQCAKTQKMKEFLPTKYGKHSIVSLE